MATIGLLCFDDGDRERLALMAGEAGHLVHGAPRLAGALEVMEASRPRIMLVVDSPQADAETLVRELLRAAPLVPVVVALKQRDATRAVRLMRAGAAEVVAPPWTRESLNACLSRAGRLPGTVYSVLRAPRKPKAAAYAMAVLTFFAAAFGVSTLKRQERQRVAALQKKESFDLPTEHPAGLAFRDGRLWVADWFTQTLYAHDPADMSIKRLVHFTDETPVAIAFGADAAWTATAAGKIAKRMLDEKLTAVQEYRSGEGDTLGLAFDGLYLWTIDSRKGRIQKRLLDNDLSLISSYKYPGSRPAALVWDGKSLWSLDAGDRQLVRHNLERPDEALEKIALPEYADGRHRPIGLAWDGERFWTVGEAVPKDSGAARVYRHAIWGLK
jgi:CheY-like chemotaxis protein